MLSVRAQKLADALLDREQRMDLGGKKRFGYRQDRIALSTRKRLLGSVTVVS